MATTDLYTHSTKTRALDLASTQPLKAFRFPAAVKTYAMRYDEGRAAAFAMDLADPRNTRLTYSDALAWVRKLMVAPL